MRRYTWRLYNKPGKPQEVSVDAETLTEALAETWRDRTLADGGAVLLGSVALEPETPLLGADRPLARPQFRNHGEEIAAALAQHRAGEVARLEPAGHDDPLGELFRTTTPKPGAPGVRIDDEGREWYSAAWISAAPEQDKAPTRPLRGLRRIL